jgi:hypothetical protein
MQITHVSSLTLNTDAIVQQETRCCHSYNKNGGIMAKQQKATGTTPVMGESMEDEIRSLAYQLYCEDGFQNGRDVEYWLQAEKQVLVRRKAHLRKVL